MTSSGRAARLARWSIDRRALVAAKLHHPRLVTAIAAGDDMVHPRDGSLRSYFKIGASALRQIRAGLQAAGAPPPTTILDLPSGYGRVLRYLRVAWPDARISAMELDPDAVRFCADTFGARGIASSTPLWSVAGVPSDFDLLWSGSLLTHFDAPDWVPTLEYFRDRLRPGGTLVLTTHGELSIALLAGDREAIALAQRHVDGWSGDYGLGERGPAVAAEARASGFGFTHYPGGEGSPFGLSASTEEWVRRTAAEVDGLELVHHVPMGWFHHQDVWTFTRGADHLTT